MYVLGVADELCLKLIEPCRPIYALSPDDRQQGRRSRRAIENHTDRRVLPGLWVAGPALDDLVNHRRPFLTAKQLLTNQTFRDIFRADTLNVDQRLKITSLTFLFTDLKGSTELYERVGDLAAFDLVRAHFRVLQDV